MISHDALVVFLTLYVVAAVGHLPLQLGQRIDQLEPLLIKTYAEPVYQKRGFSVKRQDLIGSWALRAVTCPENTSSCGSSTTAMLACCPKSTICSSYAYRIACCATSARCDTTAATFPKCGDPSWTLWAGGRDTFFCCQAGEIGYITTTGDSGACGPGTLKPTGSQVATSVAQAVGGDQPPQTSTPPGNDGSKTGNTSTTPSSSRTSISSDPSITPNVSTGTTGSSLTNPTDTSSTGNSQNQSPNGSSNTATSSGSPGLPTGAIAGIAVGGVVILILAGVAIFFALKAGKRKGHAEAMAAFQQEQRNLPGNNIYQSGVSTPGAVVPPVSPPPPQPHGQQTQWKSDNTSVVAEKYGETRQGQPNVPPQWSAPTDHPEGPRYEADATNVYPSSNHAEMDAYHNQRGY